MINGVVREHPPEVRTCRGRHALALRFLLGGGVGGGEDRRYGFVFALIVYRPQDATGRSGTRSYVDDFSGCDFFTTNPKVRETRDT